MRKILPLLSCLALTAAPVWAAPSDHPPKTPDPVSCGDGLPAAKFSEKSLYNLDATWIADTGQELKLAALRGRPQIVALFFTNCQHSCPFIVNDMKALETKLPQKAQGKVDFLLVSIDPERDTPAALRAFRKKHGLSDRWRLLRGSAEDVKKLANLIGFSYSPGSQLQFAHSLLITVLNPTGEIVYQQSGIGNTRDDALGAVMRVVRR
jgi:protein SCO1/2